MRCILGIDTASPRGSLALLVDGVVRGSVELPPGGHSSGLAAGAESLARGAGLALADLAGIAISRGPGSFTGLRIGLAWAKGVAVAAGVPLALVSAHEAAARAAHAAGSLRITLSPGERKEVQIALWGRPEPGEARGARPRALAEPVSVPESEAADHLLAIAAGEPFVALPSNETISALLEEDGVPFRPPSLLAEAVAEVGNAVLLAGGASEVGPAAPSYGRAPNARKPGS